MSRHPDQLLAGQLPAAPAPPMCKAPAARQSVGVEGHRIGEPVAGQQRVREQQEASARAAVAARDLEREIAPPWSRGSAPSPRRSRRGGYPADLDDRFASLILDHDENRGTQDVDGANDRREPPIEVNLRPAEGSLGGYMEARPPEMMPSPPRPAAEFDRETAAGLDVFAKRDTHFGLAREFRRDPQRNGTE